MEVITLKSFTVNWLKCQLCEMESHMDGILTDLINVGLLNNTEETDNLMAVGCSDHLLDQ